MFIGVSNVFHSCSQHQIVVFFLLSVICLAKDAFLLGMKVYLRAHIAASRGSEDKTVTN